MSSEVRLPFRSRTLYMPTRTPEMLAQVVFMEEAADPVEALVIVVANPDPRVACEAEASEAVDFLVDPCFSGNLISSHFTFHQQSFNSASSSSFLYPRKAATAIRTESASDRETVKVRTGNPSELALIQSVS